MAVEVNEAWRDHEAFGVNHALGSGIDQVAHCANLPIADGHCTARPRVAAPIEDVTIDDEEIVFGFLRPGGETREGHDHGGQSHACEQQLRTTSE